MWRNWATLPLCFFTFVSCTNSANFKLTVLNTTKENIDQIIFGVAGNLSSPDSRFYITNLRPNTESDIYSFRRDYVNSLYFGVNPGPSFVVYVNNYYEPGFSTNSNGSTNFFTNTIRFFRSIKGYFQNEAVYRISVLQNPNGYYVKSNFQNTTDGIIEIGSPEDNSYIGVQQKVLWFYDKLQ